MEGLAALFNICYGDDATAPPRRQRAVRAGGRKAASAAMLAHPEDAEVQRHGQMVIDLIKCISCEEGPDSDTEDEDGGEEGVGEEDVLDPPPTRWSGQQRLWSALF